MQCQENVIREIIVALTILATATARSTSQVPIWRTRWPLSRSLILST